MPPVTEQFARRATLRRALRLLGEFRYEQPDPARFYGAIAADTAVLVADLHGGATGRDLSGTLVLDVGGGPGYFADEFAARGARYLPIERRPARDARGGPVGATARCADPARRCPFATTSPTCACPRMWPSTWRIRG